MMRGSRKHKRFHRKTERGFWIAILSIALLILLLRLFLFHTVRIEGSSMEATLSGGETALVMRMFGPPDRGDIVQCRFPGRDGSYVKRVIGLPGETVELRDGIAYIDGKAISEPYLSSFPKDYSIVLGEDEYLLLGDNRAESYDSREPDMGPVSEDDFIGRLCLVLWPLHGIK